MECRDGVVVGVSTMDDVVFIMIPYEYELFDFNNSNIKYINNSMNYKSHIESHTR